MSYEDDWDQNYIGNMKEIDSKTESSIVLNYRFITEKYFEMYEVALNAGTIMPYRFNPLGLAYRGHDHDRPTKFNNFDPEVKERLKNAYARRNELINKYTHSESDPKERYTKFLDKEIYDFIEEFPQYRDVILEEK